MRTKTPFRKFQIAFRFLLVCIFISIHLSAQEKKIIYVDMDWKPVAKRYAFFYREITFDANGKPTGITRDHFITGELQWEGKLISQNPDTYDSVCTWYYFSGKVQQRATYAKGKLNGPVIAYFKNGKTDETAFYVDNKKEGINKRYSEYTGFLTAEENYHNGMQEGLTVYYFPNGKKQQEEHYTNGKKNGEMIRWDDDGKMQYKCVYKDNLLEGEKQVFYNSGCISEKGSYHNDKRVGIHYSYSGCDLISGVANYSDSGTLLEFKGYNEKHLLIEHDVFDPIKKLEMDTGFFSDGSISSLGTKSGKMNVGREIHFYPDRKLSRAIIYRKRQVISDSSWFQNGQLARVEINLSTKNYGNVYYDSTGRIKTEVIPDSLLIYIGKENGNCLYGFKDYWGNWVIRPRFTMIYKERNGFFIVEENSKRGIYYFTGKEIIAPQYDQINVLGGGGVGSNEKPGYVDHRDYFGVFIARKNGSSGLVNIKNEILIPFVYGDIEQAGVGLFNVRIDKEYFFADTNGYVLPAGLKNKARFNEWGFALIQSDTANLDSNRYNGLGIINRYGKIIIPAVYNQIYTDKIRGDYFWVGKNKKYGLCDTTGKMLLDTAFQVSGISDYYSIWPAYNDNNTSFFDDSMAVVGQNGKWGIVDPHGKFLLPIEYDYLNVISLNCVIYKKGKHYGILGKELKPVSSSVYSSAEVFQVGGSYKTAYKYVPYILVCKNGKYGVVNTNDSVVVPFNYDNGWTYRGEVYVIKKDSLHIISRDNLKKTQSLPPWLDFKNGIAIFGREGYQSNFSDAGTTCGVVNESGKIILQPYFHIVNVSDGGIIYTDSLGRTGIYVPGKKPRLLPEIYSSEKWQGDNLIYVMTPTGKVGVENTDGKLIVDTSYYALGDHFPKERGVWVKTKKNRNYSMENNWGYIDLKGKFIAPPVYTYPSHFVDSLAIVSANGKCGLLREDGKLVLDTIYDGIFLDVNGCFVLVKDAKYGLASAKGMLLVKPEWEWVSGFLGDNMLFYPDSLHVGAVDTGGKIVMSPVVRYKIYKTNLPSTIEYYYTESFDNDYKENPHITLEQVETHHVIRDYDTLVTITNPSAQLAAQNYAIAMGSMSHDIPSMHGDLTYVDYYCKPAPPDFEYDRDYESGDTTTRYNYSTFIVDATPYSFTVMNRTITCRPNHYSFEDDVCHSSDQYKNFCVIGDSIFPVTLDSLFDAKKNYPVLLNNLLAKYIAAMEDVNFDCSNPDKYAQRAGENFSIGKDGITFYIFERDGIHYDYNMTDYVRITISYKDLAPIISEKSILRKLATKTKP